MFIVLEGRTKLSEVTKGCNSKGYREEPSNNESVQPWKVWNFQVEQVLRQRYVLDAEEGFLVLNGGFLHLDLFVFKLNLDFIWISPVFPLVSF